MNKRLKKFNLFSDRVLVVLVSLITLFLQLISFATTWDGAKVYLDGVFPYASLLFAIAIQATAYFFSNSLRKKRSILKFVALGLAICCSTYYSYIGIYNSVNSPITYMQERYSEICDRLTRQLNKEMEVQLGEIRTITANAISHISTQHQMLCSDLAQADACLAALDSAETDISASIRAPKQSAYETYEEYAAAYKAYIETRTSGNNLEAQASREGILASYGFSSLEALSSQKSRLEGTRATLYATMGSLDSSEFGTRLSTLSNSISSGIHNVSLGIAPDSSLLTELNILLQAATLLDYPTFSVAEIMDSLEVCATLSANSFMRSFEDLSTEQLLLSNAMAIKGNLDSEILFAILKLNTLLPESSWLDLEDDTYQITDLYLLPLSALSDEETHMTALFCLAMAGLVDGLSVLFAISLRGKKPLWNKRLLPFAAMDERYIPQIYASLPASNSPTEGFRSFMALFSPSPDTEADGYMLQASLKELSGFQLLTALLCQINLARIVSTEDSATNSRLLLKAGFVFWVNDILYQERIEMGGAS